MTLLMCVISLFFDQEGQKPIPIVATIPAVGEMVRQVAGDAATVLVLASATKDPHFIEATPALMAQVRSAHAFFELGMSLELWADLVADGSGNPRIGRGSPNRIQLYTGIPTLEVPSVISRADGDLHPQGNPHLWMDPVRAKMMARNVAKALTQLDAARKDAFERGLKAFEERVDRALYGEELLKLVGSRQLDRLALEGRLWAWLEEKSFGGKRLVDQIGGWLQAAKPIRGVKVIEYHKTWIYLSQIFGFELVGTIEEKPGIQPGPTYRQRLAEKARQQGVRLIIADTFYPRSLPDWVAEQSEARVVVLPNQPGGVPGTDDYFSFVGEILRRLTEK